MRHEEEELEYQLLHKEISRPHYVRAKNRIAIHRQAVLNIIKETGEDVVPELHVVTAAELDELIEQGTRARGSDFSAALINCSSDKLAKANASDPAISQFSTP